MVKRKKEDNAGKDTAGTAGQDQQDRQDQQEERDNLPEVAEIPEPGEGDVLEYGLAKDGEDAGERTASVSTDEIGSDVEMPKTPEEEAEFYKDIAQRIAAEFDNYRKRIANEFERVRDAAKEDLVSRLLVVLDHMELALKAAESASDPKAVVEGVRLIFKQMRDVLASEGLKKVETTGKFDPRYHECVDCEETEELEPDEITEVLQDGYEFKGKVIRPAKVKVAIAPKKKREPGSGEGDEGGETPVH